MLFWTYEYNMSANQIDVLEIHGQQQCWLLYPAKLHMNSSIEEESMEFGYVKPEKKMKSDDDGDDDEENEEEEEEEERIEIKRGQSKKGINRRDLKWMITESRKPTPSRRNQLFSLLLQNRSIFHVWVDSYSLDLMRS